MIYNNILEALGNTPMIKLNHMADPEGADILVKFEGLNVGGSIKTIYGFYAKPIIQIAMRELNYFFVFGTI